VGLQRHRTGYSCERRSCLCGEDCEELAEAACAVRRFTPSLGQWARYWAAKTAGFNFDRADQVDAPTYNLILWQGLVGENVAYPAGRDGRDLSKKARLAETVARIARAGIHAAASASGRRELDANLAAATANGGGRAQRS